MDDTWTHTLRSLQDLASFSRSQTPSTSESITNLIKQQLEQLHNLSIRHPSIESIDIVTEQLRIFTQISQDLGCEQHGVHYEAKYKCRFSRIHYFIDHCVEDLKAMGVKDVKIMQTGKMVSKGGFQRPAQDMGLGDAASYRSDDQEPAQLSKNQRMTDEHLKGLVARCRKVLRRIKRS
ncbi:MAG: hypothetical protein Q9186_006830 [Xanthomendoza sp. 1 TL-2023]